MVEVISEVLADQPELMALANLASVPASRIASAFNDPPSFFQHLSLEELQRLTGACQRLATLSTVLVAAVDEYRKVGQAILDAAELERNEPD